MVIEYLKAFWEEVAETADSTIAVQDTSDRINPSTIPGLKPRVCPRPELGPKAQG